MFLSNFMNNKSELPYLRGMDFSSRMARKNPLLHVRMFLGNLCNLRCNYCFTDSFSTTRGANANTVVDADEYFDDTLPMRERLSILYTLARHYGTRTVLINGKGEPTMEPGLDRLIRGLNAMNLTPVLATNGTSLAAADGYNWQYMYDHGVSLLLKMNMRGNAIGESAIFGLRSDSATYQKIHDITHTDAGMAWVRRFAKNRAIAFNCVLMGQTAGDNGAPAVLRFCRENGVVPWFDWYIGGGRGGGSFAVPPVRRRELIQRLTDIDAEYGLRHDWTDGMNLGCTPEMNQNFVQITDHGRIFLTTKLGMQSINASMRYGIGCRDCDSFDRCVRRNINNLYRGRTR